MRGSTPTVRFFSLPLGTSRPLDPKGGSDDETKGPKVSASEKWTGPPPDPFMLIGGIMSSVLFEVSRLGFRFYLQNFAHYEALFGSIGGLVRISPVKSLMSPGQSFRSKVERLRISRRFRSSCSKNW